MEKISTRAEAVRDLVMYYYTGKPCKYGHIEKRYTVSAACTKCTSIAVVKRKKKLAADIKEANIKRGK